MMVLWIGYLQWHFRTHGSVNPPEPVLQDCRNIENRDALLTYDRKELLLDENGKKVTRWDGVSYKESSVTGELVPDEDAQAPVYRYVNPRKAEWPGAEYIVGNPPFIGTKRMRAALGDGYVDALRKVYGDDLDDSADYVMFWWDIAAGLLNGPILKRFGFITTNSITQSFNRRVLTKHIEGRSPVSIVFAIPDHPWVDSASGAAVRIAMTVGESGQKPGSLVKVAKETASGGDEVTVALRATHGEIAPNLRVGARLTTVKPLLANGGISGMGVALHGAGFVLQPEEAATLRPYGASVIRPYLGGRDLLQVPRERYIIDFSFTSVDEAREANAPALQRVIDRVKPERDENRRASIRENWWRFGWERPLVRRALAGLGRYIGTTETSKHRIFQLIDAEMVPDHMVIALALEGAYVLGILSCQLHCRWALAAGGRLGVGNDPRYNKTRCFETFPFPDPTPEQADRIRDLAEKLDAHRKRQQAEHPKLTLTGMYNVLEKLRSGETLDAKDKTIHEQGLVSVLRELHDELDRAVFAAYGWDDLAERLVGLPGATTPLPDKPAEQQEAEEELLTRLVALNAERAAEEARGHVRWLRPEYQNPNASESPARAEQGQFEEEEKAPAPVAAAKKLPWPKNMREQVAAVRGALREGHVDAEGIAARFKRKPVADVQAVLEALEELGMVTVEAGEVRLPAETGWMVVGMAL